VCFGEIGLPVFVVFIFQSKIVKKESQKVLIRCFLKRNINLVFKGIVLLSSKKMQPKWNQHHQEKDF